MFSHWVGMMNLGAGQPTFDFDDERTKAAETQLALLQKLSHISEKVKKDERGVLIARRETYSEEIAKLRLSPYYLHIKARVDQQQNLVPAELYFYAMVTDNVSKLNLRALQDMSFYYHSHHFTQNLETLICALKWQQEINPAAKQELSKALRRLLLARISKYADKNDVVHFLNLRGVNLSGANLAGAHLRYIDMEGADLSHCNLFDTEFRDSILDFANLSAANCYRERDERQNNFMKGPSIVGCSASSACFNGMSAFSGSSCELIFWYDSDFTGASFRDAKVGRVDLSRSVLDYADIRNGLIELAGCSEPCSMRYANLVGTALHGTVYGCIDSSTKLVSDEAILSTNKLIIELDDIYKRVSQKIDKYISDSEKSDQLEAFRVKLAESLIYQIKISDLSDTWKAEWLNCTIRQPIFQPEESVKYFSNAANRYYQAASSLFFSHANENHEYYTTPAISKLEQARDVYLSRSANAIQGVYQ